MKGYLKLSVNFKVKTLDCKKNENEFLCQYSESAYQ